MKPDLTGEGKDVPSSVKVLLKKVLIQNKVFLVVTMLGPNS